MTVKWKDAVAAVCLAFLLVAATACSDKEELPSGPDSSLAASVAVSSTATVQLDISPVAVEGDGRMVLGSNGQLVAYGDNALAQLGLGDNAKVEKPTIVPIDEKVASVRCFSEATVAVTVSGKVYIWGNLPRFTIHGADYDTIVKSPARIPLEEPVKDVAMSNTVLLLLTQNGTVYSMGYDKGTGCLGLGENTGYVGSPQKIAIDARVTQVAAADSFGLCLTEDGAAYLFGKPYDVGALESASSSAQDTSSGTRETAAEPIHIYKPTKIELDEKIIQVAAGGTAGFLLTEKGQVYANLCNDALLMGLGRNLTDADRKLYSFRRLPHDLTFTKVYVDTDHAIGITKDNMLYLWGNYLSETQQQGTEPSVETLKTPTISKSYMKFSQLSLSKGGFIGVNSRGEIVGRGWISVPADGEASSAATSSQSEITAQRAGYYTLNLQTFVKEPVTE